MQTTSDKNLIHVKHWGNNGPNILMIHGGAQGSSGGEFNFEMQAALAERGYQITVPDRPGHGQSADPGRPDDAEADGVWVADMLGDSSHLVGHSFGGCVALAAAVRRPAAVRSLTLIEPAMIGLGAHDARVRKFLFRLVMARFFSFTNERRAKRSLALLGIPEEVNGGLLPAQLNRIGKALGQLRLPPNARIKHQLAEVKRLGIPLLIVTGGWNPAFEISSDVAGKLGGGRRAVIQSPHHFPQRVSNEFNQILEAFMKESDAVRR